MRIFKTKWFARFARKEHINDEMLMNAIHEIERGLVDGELGAKSNLSPIELDVYNKLAHIYLGFSNEDFIKAQQNGEVEEVHP